MYNENVKSNGIYIYIYIENNDGNNDYDKRSATKKVISISCY